DAYIMDTEFGVEMPRELQIEFSQVIQAVTDASGKEITSAEIWEQFKRNYLEAEGPVELVDYRLKSAHAGGLVDCVATIRLEGEAMEIAARGDGPIDVGGSGLKADCG